MPEKWNILVRTGALGDFILTWPLYRALHGEDRNLLLISRRKYLELLPDATEPEAFLDIDSAAMSQVYATGAEVTAPTPLKDKIRDGNIFLFAHFNTSLHQKLNNWGAAMIRWIEPRPRQAPHAAMQFLRQAGFELEILNLCEAPWSRPLSGRQGRTLWLHPGSGSNQKNAPLDSFVRIALEWLNSDPARRIIVSFGEADEALRAPFFEQVGAHAEDCEALDNPGLGELRSRLQRDADLYVGNDSGVSHLAGALGVPCLLNFCSTNPIIWRPFGHVSVTAMDRLRCDFRRFIAHLNDVPAK